jgi:Domain of unknown function (DUF4142)
VKASLRRDVAKLDPIPETSCQRSIRARPPSPQSTIGEPLAMNTRAGNPSAAAEDADFVHHAAAGAVAEHQWMIGVFERVIAAGQDRALRNFAVRTLPLVKEHLAIARKIVPMRQADEGRHQPSERRTYAGSPRTTLRPPAEFRGPGAGRLRSRSPLPHRFFVGSRGFPAPVASAVPHARILGTGKRKRPPSCAHAQPGCVALSTLMGNGASSFSFSFR